MDHEPSDGEDYEAASEILNIIDEDSDNPSEASEQVEGSEPIPFASIEREIVAGRASDSNQQVIKAEKTIELPQEQMHDAPDLTAHLSRNVKMLPPISPTVSNFLINHNEASPCLVHLSVYIFPYHSFCQRQKYQLGIRNQVSIC